MSSLYSPFEEKFSIVATVGLQPVFTYHSAGQEGQRRVIEWEVTIASIYPEDCFGKVKHFKG